MDWNSGNERSWGIELDIGAFFSDRSRTYFVIFQSPVEVCYVKVKYVTIDIYIYIYIYILL